MSNQNRYATIDTSTQSERSFGSVVTRHGNLDDAITVARQRGLAVVHPSELLGGHDYNQTTDASRDFFTLVEHDMRGIPWRYSLARARAIVSEEHAGFVPRGPCSSLVVTDDGHLADDQHREQLAPTEEGLRAQIRDWLAAVDEDDHETVEPSEVV